MGKFELFRDRHTRASKGPAATVQARGAFSLNASTLKHLGNPDAVHLYFDDEAKRVGIEKADPSSPYAFAARPVGTTSTRLVNAKVFMDINGIAYDKTVPVGLSFEGDMAVLDVAPLIGGQRDGTQ